MFSKRFVVEAIAIAMIVLFVWEGNMTDLFHDVIAVKNEKATSAVVSAYIPSGLSKEETLTLLKENKFDIYQDAKMGHEKEKMMEKIGIKFNPEDKVEILIARSDHQGNTLKRFLVGTTVIINVVLINDRVATVDGSVFHTGP
jgi:hypothetical protein